MRRYLWLFVLGIQLCIAAGWEDVRALRSGDEIQVVTMDQKSWIGRCVRVTDEDISLRVDRGFFRRQEKAFPRESVFRVSRVGHGRNTLIGLAIGVGAGAALAAALSPRIDKGYGGALSKQGLAGLTIGIGSGSGALIGYN